MRKSRGKRRPDQGANLVSRFSGSSSQLASGMHTVHDVHAMTERLERPFHVSTSSIHTYSTTF